MRGVRVQHPIHRGTVPARGVWLRDHAELRWWLLHWRSDFRLDLNPRRGWVLRWTESRRVRALELVGVPLVERDGDLWARPPGALEPDLSAPGSPVLRLLDGGVSQLDPLDAFEPIDAWSSIDLSTLAIVEATSLNGPPIVSLALVQAPPDVRRRLSPELAEPSAVARELEVSLRERASGDAPPEARPTGWLARWIRAFAGWLSRPEGSASPSPASPSPASPSKAIGRPPSWLARTLGRLGRRMRRWIMSSGLGRHLGRRQAELVAQMMKAFDEGDLDEALRRAIPLSDEAAGGGDPALGLPKPRDTLELARVPAERGVSLALGPDLFESLRQRYRDAVNRLKAQGRIREAAFVLADLLGENRAAVELLEAHDEAQLAAELAESRQLPPELVVRQWLVAKDVDRAALHAIRHQAELEAILLLERRREHERAALFRRFAAERARRAGRYGDAARLLAPLPEERGQVAELCRAAIDLDPVTHADLWPLELEHRPEAFSARRDQLARILETATSDVAPALHRAWAPCSRDPRLAPLRRAVVRRMLADSATEPVGAHLGPNRGQLADPVLESQLESPALRSARPELSNPSLQRWTFAPSTGPLPPIRDIVGYGDHSSLLALGYAGARWVGSDGRTRRDFDGWVDVLIPCTDAFVALGISREKDRVAVRRLDLARGTTELWTEIEGCTGWAPTIHEGLWFVARGDEVVALDVGDSSPRAVWRVTGLGGTVQHIDSAPDHVVLGSRGPEHLDVWTYRRRSMILASRRELRAPPGTRLEFSPAGVWGVRVERSSDHRFRLQCVPAEWGAPHETVANPEFRLDVGDSPLELRALQLRSGFVLLTMERDSRLEHRLFAMAAPDAPERARFSWTRDTEVASRHLSERKLVFGSASGRIVHYDPALRDVPVELSL